jgi:uncharacterized protein (TIGR02301 family)
MIRRLLPLALVLALAGAMPAAAQGPFPFFRFFYTPRDTTPTPPRDTLAPPRPTLPRATPALRTPAPGQPQHIEGPPPPYEADLARLAEILGALHYLHPLCGTPVGNRWRGEMEALIDAEQPGPERRGRMVASFNRGYFTYEQTYRTCTDAAGLVIARFLNEGARLSREIAIRYAY